MGGVMEKFQPCKNVRPNDVSVNLKNMLILKNSVDTLGKIKFINALGRCMAAVLSFVPSRTGINNKICQIDMYDSRNGRNLIKQLLNVRKSLKGEE